jgi:phytoene dehydrogenase-like protein
MMVEARRGELPEHLWCELYFQSAHDATVAPAGQHTMSAFAPPDIEQKVGLTGGHIFQGECLPPYMWRKRLSVRTPMQGVYLCGACTHPGGSVIGINGRNAAMAVLKDMGES